MRVISSPAGRTLQVSGVANLNVRQILAVVLCAIFLALGTPWAGTQSPSDTESPPDAVPGMTVSIADALKTAQNLRDRLKAELEAAQREGRALAGELTAYRIQLSTYGSMAALPSVDPETLAKATAEQRRSQTAVKDTLDRLEPRRKILAELRRQTEQQLSLNQTQFAELKKIPASASGKGDWLEKLGGVIRIQKEILTLAAQIDVLYADQATDLSAVALELTKLGETLTAARDQAMRTAVFTRGENPLSMMDRADLKAEADRLHRFSQSLRDPDFWNSQIGLLLDGGSAKITALTLLGIGLLLGLLRLRTALRKLLKRTDSARWPWRAALLAMVQRTVAPLGLLIFLSLNTGTGLIPDPTTVTGALIAFCWVWLFSDWARCFLVLSFPLHSWPHWERLTAAVRWLVRLSRVYAGAYIFLTWSLGSAGMLKALVRLAFEAALVIGVFVLWRRWDDVSGMNGQPPPKRHWRTQAGIIASYTVVLAGPVLDLAGYGALAIYWYVGWGLTLVAVLWSALAGQSLREIERPVAPDTAPPVSSKPFTWVMLRLAWLLWGVGFLLLLALAWGGGESLASGLGTILNHPFTIGEMTLRLSGVLAGLLLLFFTHLAVRLWRHSLLGRFLAHSGMTHGVRESIVTVSGYLIWALGILMALHAFGFSTTSLTVAFGALGIGLGFGLQNIFNNFISGLILLFERPIQVGDDIEINGTWARVTRINVRATVVQTYDNASLIIPNSDLISNQVTNWSHKDPYVRRSINVGVAYGSDTELVRRTLLEVAANTAHIRRRPEPDVLFADFGDSTLNFQLRVWTDIDHMLKVETDVRFEIDRRFRERGIEIAFPQRDIHIRSVQSASPVAIQAEQTAASSSQGATEEDSR